MNILYERLILVLLVLVLFVVMWCMYDNYYVYTHSLNNNIAKYKPSQGEAVPEDSPLSSDMVAWITIDGTNIDYPVMQGVDNVKYLNTDSFGNYSLSGSIYLDSRNASDFSDDYSMIYGHHMEYGQMFGALDDFLSKPYLTSHTTGTLIIGKNAEKIYNLEVFASMRVSATEKIVFDMEQNKIQQFICDNAEIQTGSEKNDRILGLSTCAGTDFSDRIVVFCYISEFSV